MKRAAPQAIREWLLAELRIASLQSRLVTADLDEIGVSLKCNMITPVTAVVWLHACGLAHVLPPTKKGPQR